MKKKNARERTRLNVYQGSGRAGQRDDDADLNASRSFRAHGYALVPAWVQMTGGKGGLGRSRSQSVKSPEAERKQRQRERQSEDGWAEYQVKAPRQDQEVRELLARIGIAIKDPDVRAALWTALRNPTVVRIGRRLLLLSGLRRLLALLIFGQEIFSPER